MIDQTVVTGIGSRIFIETAARPVKFAAVDDGSANAGTMATDELGQ